MNVQETIHQGQRRILEKKFLPRKYPDNDILNLPKIISFLGGRRVGKSSLMMSLVQQDLEAGRCRLDDVIFIDFSELNNKNIDLSEIYREYSSKNLFFVLDEIQELNDFEDQLTFLYNEGCRIYISGSNANMLSQDIATKLRGRTIEVHVQTLDFEEFLWFNASSKDISVAKLDEYFSQYLDRGGYPEVVLTDSEVGKKSILQSYLDVMLYKDLVDRYSLRNQELMLRLLQRLILSHTKNISVHKLFNTFKSQGFSLSKNTLYEYLQYIESVFFVSRLSKFYGKSYQDKVYLIDNGYMNLYSQEKNFGQKFESVIYRHLKSTLPARGALGYVDKGYEVDFTDGETNWQSCFRMTDQNSEREMTFLKQSKDSGQTSKLIYMYSELFSLDSAVQIRYPEFLFHSS